ncbi:MAG: FAD-dependent oxidoreductase [Sorangiineae bacterium]|nr:FAD-dependent oxidoreductase [Polyangiaceae bacterium]MEB2324729.1 FAD-dependent oxidoreductase [Sorangiineae bacterium]
MSESKELLGADLTAGVALADLKDGAPLLGHAEGEQVMLVRRGDDLFAVGSTCTHYGGPLDEGLVVGHTVRCPWHHAHFDLCTGAPSAPALGRIPCFAVERDGERVRVGKRLPLAAPAAVSGPGRVVIVGAGPAGNAAAETLRREGYAGAIMLLGAEATPPVDRPNLSKDYLAGTAPEAWMQLRDADFYRAQAIEFRAGTPVASLDVAGRAVVLESGERVPFDALVLACGAEPVRLSIPGAERILSLRTLADSRAIVAQAVAGKRAVVLGASFIGLEVAASLRARGVEVDVVGLEKLPLERVLGAALGELVRSVHEEHGVRFHLGRSAKSVDDRGVTLDDGSAVAADFVVGGVGVRPRTQLAEAAGLEVAHGVVVDATFQAAPGIYAVGDLARFPDERSGERVRIEHWVVAGRQGEAAARAILGKTAGPRAVPFFWSAHYDLVVNYVGHAPSYDRVEIDGDLAKRDAAVHYFRGEQLLAVATVGRDRYALEIERRFEAS